MAPSSMILVAELLTKPTTLPVPRAGDWAGLAVWAINAEPSRRAIDAANPAIRRSEFMVGQRVLRSKRAGSLSLAVQGCLWRVEQRLRHARRFPESQIQTRQTKA